ncbi:FAD:protein FMN transferase [Streptococcus sp.]|nr:FAD:protein FMN transferase [Streptococcus sp.]
MFHQKSQKMMGTLVSITIFSSNPLPILEEAFELLAYLEKRFSANDPNSELMQVNHAAGSHSRSVHKDLFHLIELGKKNSLIAGSRLNIAIGPLVKEWKIGFRNAKLPETAVIREKLKLTDPKDIILSKQDKKVFLRQKGMEIDLGALAKGYIADLLLDFLKKQAVSAALIDLGGNILTYGPNPKRQDGNWQIGIQDPSSKLKKEVLLLGIRNKAIVTSGIYERYFSHQNATYHHILDPMTGYPIKTDMTSLTIIAPSALEAELLSSRWFGQAPSELYRHIKSNKDLAFICITKNKKITASPSILPYLYHTKERG